MLLLLLPLLPAALPGFELPSGGGVVTGLTYDLRGNFTGQAAFDAWQQRMKEQDEDERLKHIEQKRMET